MRKLLAIFGIDRAVAYTLVGRAWSSVAGLVTLWFIVRHLSLSEQGFYYTFASILALQVIFELGMSFVVMQFASHEMVHLCWTPEGLLEGDEVAKSRLRSLFLLVVKWYGTVAILIILAVLPAGWLFFTFNDHGSTVLWHLPWVWLIFTAALNIMVIPILAIFEGCGRVAEVAAVRIAQGVVGSLSAWLTLGAGGGLFAMPIMNTMMVLVVAGWLFYGNSEFFKDIARNKLPASNICWRTEIWPFQWRIALSWLGGFFIFQLFVPVLFSYRGPAEAGRMGMSLSIVSAISAIAMAWVNTKGPQFGNLVALRRYGELNSLFKRVLFQSAAVLVVGAVAVTTARYFLEYSGSELNDRLLPMQPFLLLLLSTLVNHIVFVEASYLRSHKLEPFMGMSLVVAFLVSISTWILGKLFGSTGMMAGYFSISAVVGLGWGTWIFYSKKREWHGSLRDDTFAPEHTGG